jgi:protein-S-isoprenylcysteine O-methyltransferase Ste14
MPEYAFRIVGFVVFVAYRVVRRVWEARLRDHLKQKPTIERAHLRERVLLGVMGVLSIPMLVYFLTPWLDFAHVPLPQWLRWTGGAVMTLGVWFFSRTHAALAQNWAPVLEVREGASLVTTGPYRLVRHPMYSAALLIAIGTAALSANWLVAAGTILGPLVVFAGRLRDEERMMIDAFGDEYRAYMERTGRLTPKLRYLFRLQMRNDR